MDRHQIWRRVGSNYESLRQAAPEGYGPIVEVFLVGRPQPVRLGQVETTRDPAFPWVLLVPEIEGDDEMAAKDAQRVFVPEQYVERIEISLMPSKGRREIGFSYRDLDERAPASNDE